MNAAGIFPAAFCLSAPDGSGSRHSRVRKIPAIGEMFWNKAFVDESAASPATFSRPLFHVRLY